MVSQSSNLKRQLAFWLIVAVVFIATIAALREILLPFIMGLAVAYFLDPVVDFLEDRGFSRLWATITITVCFVLILTAMFFVLIPIIAHELSNLAANMPDHIQKLKAFVLEVRREWFGALDPADKARLDVLSADIAKQTAAWGAKTATAILGEGFAIFNFASLVVVTPVVAFYLLKDWDRIVKLVNDSLPRDHADTIRRLAGEMDVVMAGFVRGQVTVLLLLGTFYVIALSFIGLKYGVIVGVISGLISFIPFVGAVIGFVLGGVIAISQFWPEWIPIVSVLAVFIIGQTVEGNLLSPKIVGDSVNLHPVWLIFSLFVFGYLLGFLGLLIAVPVAAAIGVLVRFGFEKYYESEFYKGQGEA